MLEALETQVCAYRDESGEPGPGIVAGMARFAVVGHVEWVDFLTVPRVPLAGEIVHADKWWSEAAGGGAVAAVQLAKLAGTATFFTALGNDDHARHAEEELRAHGVEVEAAVRDRPSGARVALLDARGERTIVVQGERLVPHGRDDLPWDRLAEMDGVYFTGGDAASLRAARAARTLVATPRAHDAFKGSGVTLDALVRSAGDAGEQDDWSANLTVSTRGPDGGTYKSADGGTGSFEAAPLPGPVVDAYGAGDSFAAGLTFALGSGHGHRRGARAGGALRRRRTSRRRALRRPADRGGLGLERRCFPSGEQFEIALGDQRAVVVEVGGGLRAYSAAGRDVLDGYGADEICPSGRGQVLSPWPNRVQDGSYEFDGRRHQLRSTSRTSTTRSTGSCAGRRGRPRSASAPRRDGARAPSAARLSVRARRCASSTRSRRRACGCEHGHERRIGDLPLRDRGASVPDRRDRARRRGGPARSGAHRAAARTSAASRPAMRPVDGTEYDFRQPRPIGATQLDNCFTDLERDADGRARVELRDAARTRGDASGWTRPIRYVMLFTGDPLPDVARRSIAVEPMTCPPNAFRTGRDLIRLEPGQRSRAPGGLPYLHR